MTRASLGASRFWVAFGAIVVIALGLRIAYVMTVTRHDDSLYDAALYELEARSVAHGKGFVEPFAEFANPGTPAPPTAEHPPMTVLVLIPGAVTGSQLVMRFEMVVLGVGVVVVTGLLGRRVAGDAGGLVAAALAALYPNLWMNDGLLMSETLAALTTVAAVLLTYRLISGRRPWTAAALGAVAGLAALTRAELAMLTVLLVIPALWMLRHRRASFVRSGAAALATAAMVVGPWIVANLRRFAEPTFLSTGDGVALLGSNCPLTYSGAWIGHWALACIPRRGPAGDQSVVSRIFRRQAIDFMLNHLDRWPAVLAARLGRELSVFRPFQTASFAVSEGRPQWASASGIVMFWILIPIAAGGLVLLRRRHAPAWPLLTPWIIVPLTAVLFYGQPRFRAPAEPLLVVLAAVAIVSWVHSGRAK